MNIKPDNIVSIHNYCDRWCERCRFVDRCAVGSSEKLLETELKMELALTEEEKNKIMFQHVADSFAEAAQMLEQMITEAGLDYEEICREAKENPPEEVVLTKRQERIKELTMDYATDMMDWMEKNSNIFQPDDLTSRALTQPDDPEQFLRSIKDAIETVNWYSFFISAKSQRAFSGKQEDFYDTEEERLQGDANGSAKIALIAVGRSIKAWETLMKAFPEIDMIIIGFLAQLQKISRNLLLEFPNAKQFIRPGFDEPKYDHIQ